MGGEVSLSLPLDSQQPVRPRDILASLAPYGVTLRTHSTDSNQARINRDIRNISLRTLAALVLTIPILILVWSPNPLIASTTTSHSIQLVLATLIIGVAWPVYAGSFRSAYYLHRADLGVLTSFSTLTSYGFSVVAFGFEVAGRDIGAPFFETVGLLITLIFAGRTLQASTRRLGLRAVDGLGRLQPETARLIFHGVEADLDVR
jgi:Cu2+-exporting ATPase